MFGFLKKKKKEVNVPETIDKIEAAVYEVLKPCGFRKHGRTLHRFVSGDISQVVHFQSGLRSLQGKMCVNVGIGVPECIDRVFHPENTKKRYRVDECTMIASVYGKMSKHGKRKVWCYDLSESSEKITQTIIKELEDVIIPAFDVLSTREAILEKRKNYSWLHLNGVFMLDECMIHGHLGNMEKARELFEKNYDDAVVWYNKRVAERKKDFLRQRSIMLLLGQGVTEENTGYVKAWHEYIDYLDELAVKLGFRE